MATPLYDIENLVQRYDDRPTLQLPSLTIETGTIVGLVGHNGSGKSTLLRLLAFVEAPFGGDIRFRGVPEKPFSRRVRFRITLLTQTPYLLRRTVFANVAHGLKLRGETSRVQERVAESLAMAGLPENVFGHRNAHRLSGGEAQRVALAARLALQPEVLLMDEPTANVDAASTQRIKEAALKARQEWGTTLVIASHDWGWLHEVCDDIVHLYNGRFVGRGMETVLSCPWHERGGGVWEKVLADGQRLPVSPPPSNASAAVLSAEATVIRPVDAGHDGSFHLRGMVTRLARAKRNGLVAVSAVAGDMSFSALMAEEEILRYRLLPGKPVMLGYDPEDLVWI